VDFFFLISAKQCKNHWTIFCEPNRIHWERESSHVLKPSNLIGISNVKMLCGYGIYII